MGRYSFRGTRGFTRARLHVGKDSARIFRVSRGTIMRRVRLFDLEHLSLSSTRTDEAIDSIIIWQDSLEVNPSVLIGSFLVGILPNGPFPWKRS